MTPAGQRFDATTDPVSRSTMGWYHGATSSAAKATASSTASVGPTTLLDTYRYTDIGSLPITRLMLASAGCPT
ncbi:hypothetical protein [Rhodococcus sp. BP22]|uniref:hypothetical protein n=1 Tax=Rhodococcus sp. BP22 TaxID=2758566 RepID=UPI001648E431|nr:hypothetical protein [Rhodococcus sp. BP22]